MTIQLFQLLFFSVGLLYPSVHVSAVWPLAQAVHESGKFTSNLAVSYHNLFGMMYPSVRKTTAIGKTDKGFAIYRSKLDCIRDYFMFLDQLELKTDEQLVTYIKTRYATDARYYTKVAAAVEQLRPQLFGVGDLAKFSAGGLALGLVVNLVTKAAKA